MRLRPMAMVVTAALIGGLVGFAASAEEKTLISVGAFPDRATQSKLYVKFIEIVNREGKGVLQINHKGGGGKLINPFELAKALSKGVVHMANLPGAYYTNLMPEADALKMGTIPMRELRERGAWTYLNDLHQKKVNAFWLARQKDLVPFHLYLTKPVDTSKPMNEWLKGYKIRVTPIYRPFFASMGASMIRTTAGDVYTALERGTVDGYGWPIQSIYDFGWHSVTKYRVDPGFFNSAVEILVNLDTWKALTDQQKAVLFKARDWLETEALRQDREISEREKRRQTQAGIKAITLEGRRADEYLKRAYETGWTTIIKNNPETGPKLKQLLQ